MHCIQQHYQVIMDLSSYSFGCVNLYVAAPPSKDDICHYQANKVAKKVPFIAIDDVVTKPEVDPSTKERRVTESEYDLPRYFIPEEKRLNYIRYFGYQG